MGEIQWNKWLQAMPACADINSAVQELTDTTFVNSEQHKDATNARQARDNKDSVALLGILQDCNPFSLDPSLRNIVTCVVAEDRVNATDAKKVGKAIVDTMEGMDALTYMFKRNRQVVTMAHKLSVKVDDGTCLGVEHGYFFVYSSHGYHLECVKFNEELWASMMERYEFFWMNYVAPELLTGAMIPVPSRAGAHLEDEHAYAGQQMCKPANTVSVGTVVGKKSVLTASKLPAVFCVAFVDKIARRTLPRCHSTE